MRKLSLRVKQKHRERPDEIAFSSRDRIRGIQAQ